MKRKKKKVPARLGVRSSHTWRSGPPSGGAISLNSGPGRVNGVTEQITHLLWRRRYQKCRWQWMCQYTNRAESSPYYKQHTLKHVIQFEQEILLQILHFISSVSNRTYILQSWRNKNNCSNIFIWPLRGVPKDAIWALQLVIKAYMHLLLIPVAQHLRGHRLSGRSWTAWKWASKNA